MFLQRKLHVSQTSIDGCCSTCWIKSITKTTMIISGEMGETTARLIWKVKALRELCSWWKSCFLWAFKRFRITLWFLLVIAPHILMWANKWRERKNRNKYYPPTYRQSVNNEWKKNHNNSVCMMKQYKVKEKNVKRKVKRFFLQSRGLPVYEVINFCFLCWCLCARVL